MHSGIAQRAKQMWRRASRPEGAEIATPEGRRAALRHFHLFDHAFLRVLWSNQAQVAPGVYRSNQPDPRRVARYADMGIRTIISLRGRSRRSYTLLEEEACARHDIALVTRQIGGKRLSEKDRLLDLLDAFREVEKPFLIHCKSGADRAGFAAALYLLAEEGASVGEARRQLHWRHFHWRNSVYGILDHALDAYEADSRATPMGIRDWIETRYDPERLTAEWKAQTGR
ncbi:phosphatase domain-containing protein [Tranquillimonas alkanivorans]|uniref:Tyrosine phosphatase family protein n=1 Tax=Tranquillimonas alkanivorans TaxID=441119 RepID=A0A1I5MCX9_9RHOB|nr:tyrosine-protein phosphatase [Tranquillimonas alkanivorans]SFP06831.1 Tyrosine phosphatase family protein [Tranquillimonas alkanivorans]